MDTPFRKKCRQEGVLWILFSEHLTSLDWISLSGGGGGEGMCQMMMRSIRPPESKQATTLQVDICTITV
jgi:hypothetical protein